jgi:hypothetical protein
MLHTGRIHQVVDVLSLEDLAAKLTGQSWTLCTGFRIGTMLVLNDATSEDGAPEWAVFKAYPHPGNGSCATQIESVPFGWMTLATALDHLQRLQDGRLCSPMGRYTLNLHHPKTSCALCA